MTQSETIRAWDFPWWEEVLFCLENSLELLVTPDGDICTRMVPIQRKAEPWFLVRSWMKQTPLWNSSWWRNESLFITRSLSLTANANLLMHPDSPVHKHLSTLWTPAPLRTEITKSLNSLERKTASARTLIISWKFYTLSPQPERCKELISSLISLSLLYLTSA